MCTHMPRVDSYSPDQFRPMYKHTLVGAAENDETGHGKAHFSHRCNARWYADAVELATSFQITVLSRSARGFRDGSVTASTSS